MIQFLLLQLSHRLLIKYTFIITMITDLDLGRHCHMISILIFLLWSTIIVAMSLI